MPALQVAPYGSARTYPNGESATTRLLDGEIVRTTPVQGLAAGRGAPRSPEARG